VRIVTGYFVAVVLFVTASLFVTVLVIVILVALSRFMYEAR